MITRYECERDGVPLSLLDERIFVTDISEMEPDEQLTITPYAVRMGSRRVRKKRDSLSVVVSFIIGTQDVEERKRICQKVQGWARKGRYLTINDRAWQRLRAVCEVLPRLSSAQNWQEEIRMEFTAYELPYWEAVTPMTLTTVGSGELSVPGMVDAPCDVTITNTSGSTISTVTVKTGLSSMTFEGLGMAADATMEVGHSEDLTLYARIGGSSVLAKRTETSDDDLLCAPGQKNVMSVTADGSVKAVFTVRGLYE